MQTMLVLKAVSNNRLMIGSKTPFPNPNIFCRNKSEKNGVKKEGVQQNGKEALPEEPTTCCMSGCANCVWLEYAEKINQICKDQGDEALKKICEKITDPNMKTFLLSELRMKSAK